MILGKRIHLFSQLVNSCFQLFLSRQLFRNFNWPYPYHGMMHIHLKRRSGIANKPSKTPMDDVGLKNTQKGSKTLPLSHLSCGGWAKRVANYRTSAQRVSVFQGGAEAFERAYCSLWMVHNSSFNNR